MSFARRDHVAQARDALAATDAYRGEAPSVGDQVTTVSDLATIARLIEDLAGQTRRDLAEWLTVGAHLQQAQLYATDLARCLDHARSLLAYHGTQRAA